MTEATLCATYDDVHLITELKAAALAPLEIEGSHHLLLPEGYRHLDITKLVEASQSIPNRKAGTVALGSLQSLLDYCEDQGAQDTAYVFADPDRRTITAVFTPEFTTWLNNDGSNKAKSQGEFAEFIEDNLADITEPAAQQLLEVATTIQAKTDINFSSAKRLDNGQVQLGYTETIAASAGTNGALSIPKEFQLGLRIFKNGEGYRLRARLKYRLLGGSVKFWYELDRPERAIEDAFAGYVNEVREKSGYRVLVGQA